MRDRNWPLRGFKTQIFEGGVKVPAFVSGGFVPENVRGSTSRELYHVTDWLPTIVGIVNSSTSQQSKTTAAIRNEMDIDIDLPSDLDGVNIWPSIISGSDTPSLRTELIYNVNPLCASGQAGPPKAGIQVFQ